MGIILALTHSLLISFGNLFVKKSYAHFGPAVEFGIFTIISLIIYIPLGIFLGIESQYLLEGLLVGFMSALLAQGSYIYVLSKGELSITGTVLATYSTYTVITSILLFGEEPATVTLFFVGVTILGTLITTLPERFDSTELKNISYILFPIIGAFLIGFSDAFSANFIDKASVGTFLVGVAIGHIPVSAFFFLFFREKIVDMLEPVRQFKKNKYGILGVLFVSLATATIFTAFQFGDASIVSPISSTFPVTTVILAVLVLKEKVSLKDLIGIIITIIGVLGVSAL